MSLDTEVLGGGQTRAS